MNYILTMGQLKTLAGLLGAQSFFSVEQEQAELSREDVIQNVFALTQRGFLVQEGEGFTCESEIKRMMQAIVDARFALVMLAPQKGSLCCYISDGGCVIIEPIAERPTEYKLYDGDLKEIFDSLCPEEEIAWEQSFEVDFKELYFDVMPDVKGLSFQADVYSLIEKCQTARALVKRTDAGLAQALYDGQEMSVDAYRAQELYCWLMECVGGKEV